MFWLLRLMMAMLMLCIASATLWPCLLLLVVYLQE
jgi:hypothetical protein